MIASQKNSCSYNKEKKCVNYFSALIKVWNFKYINKGMIVVNQNLFYNVAYFWVYNNVLEEIIFTNIDNIFCSFC